ncbi:hypothetical protein BDN67DRAFT_867991, partial [Paxillus ammoniavirescens]
MPYELVHGKKPNLAKLHQFGCTIYVKIVDTGKLNERAKAGRFVGYNSQSKEYRVYWPE